ncbi:MAG: hypothetical protein P8X42_03160 [Calditrichaceae bacterium]
MKTKTIIVLLILIFPCLVYSQNIKMNVYGAGAYKIPLGSFRYPDIYPRKGNANEGAGLNAGYQIQTFDKIYVGIHSGYQKFGPRQQVANYNIYTRAYSILLNVSYYFKQKDFRPYAALGFGLSSVVFQVETEFFEESSAKWAPQSDLCLGCDMMVTGHTALFAVLRWSNIWFRNKQFEYKNFYTVSPDFNAAVIGFEVGIKYWIL